MCIRALFPKSASILRLVEQAFWRVPPFTKWVIASSLEVILAGLSKHSSTGTLASGTSGSRRIFRSLPTWKTSEKDLAVSIMHANGHIVTETTIISYWNSAPFELSIANNILEFFVHAVFDHLILDRGVLSHSFHFLCQNILISHDLCSILLFKHCFPFVMIQVLISSGESRSGQTMPVRSWISQTLLFFICANPSKRSSEWNLFVIDNRNPVSLRNGILEYRQFEYQ